MNAGHRRYEQKREGKNRNSHPRCICARLKVLWGQEECGRIQKIVVQKREAGRRDGAEGSKGKPPLMATGTEGAGHEWGWNEILNVAMRTSVLVEKGEIRRLTS